MIGTTCVFHRRKLSQVSFLEIGWPRLEVGGVELDMAFCVLGSDYHVKANGTMYLCGSRVRVNIHTRPGMFVTKLLHLLSRDLCTTDHARFVTTAHVKSKHTSTPPPL
jgi:hypothetical protein